MGALYSRRAGRVLSMDRRLGSQVPYDVELGRVQRHQRNWSDLNTDAEDELRAARGVFWGSAIGALMWAALIAFFLLLSGCGSADTPAVTNSSTCYRCSVVSGALMQQTYSCTPTDAVQFGRACIR